MISIHEDLTRFPPGFRIPTIAFALLRKKSRNPGNLRGVTEQQIEDGLGMTAHEFKYAVLGDSAKISRYDIYRHGDDVYLVEKYTSKVIDTGYRLGESH